MAAALDRCVLQSVQGGRRILHVIATLDRGGTEVSCRALCGALHAEGYESHVVAVTRGGGSIAGGFSGVATEHGSLPAGRPARVAAFALLVRRLRPDGIIFHFFTVDHAILGAVAWACGIRLRIIKQGNPVPSDPRRAAIIRRILAVTRILGMPLVSSSRYIERTMREAGQLPVGSSVVHNGTDVAGIAARAAASQTESRDSSAAPLVVGMIARLDPIKDHATLLRALARMPTLIHGRPVHLHIVGDGALRDELAALCKRLGIADRVVFRGARSDVVAELSRWDAFVLSTTRDEGFGVVLVEALAAGVPVIASDVPACREVLVDGALGRIVPASDPDALAVALTQTLTQPPPVPSTEVVAARYGTSAMAKGYLHVLFGN